MNDQTAAERQQVAAVYKIHIVHFLVLHVLVYWNVIGQKYIEGRQPLAESTAIQLMVRNRLGLDSEEIPASETAL